MNTPDPHSTDRTFYDDTDYADVDLEPANDVTVEAPRAPRSTFAIRMEGRTISDLRELAEQKGTRPTQLARGWIEERLEQEQRQARSGEDDARPPRALLASLDAIIALLVAMLERLDTAADTPAVAQSPGSPPRVSREGSMTSSMSESIARSFTRWANFDQAARQEVSYWRNRPPRPPLALRHDPVANLELQAAFARMVVERLQDRASISVPPDVGVDFLVKSGDRCWAIEFKSADVDLTPSLEHLAHAAKHLNATAVLVSPSAPDEKMSSMAEVSGVVVRRPDELEDLLAEMAMEWAG